MRRAVLSPYFLTTREPPAMAALMLADETITLLPTPAEGDARGNVEQAVRQAPAYYEFMESWQWSMPLWRDGIVGSVADGLDAIEDVRTVAARLRDDDRYADLRPLMRQGFFEGDDDALPYVARDLLRGGPDPAVTVPVAAGLDRFASRANGVVVRAAASSVAQKAEAKLGARIFAVAIPMLAQASAERIMEAREFLAADIEPLADAIDAACGAAVVGAAADEVASLVAEIEAAARSYAVAFAEHEADLCRPCDDEDDLHVIKCTASLTGVVMPADAVLRSSMAALRAMSSRRARSSGASKSVQTLPALADPLDHASVASVIVKTIGRSGR
ncbi:MAG: hypothetical protein AAF747_02375 [Planctomycetota bacterium]